MSNVPPTLGHSPILHHASTDRSKDRQRVTLKQGKKKERQKKVNKEGKRDRARGKSARASARNALRAFVSIGL